MSSRLEGTISRMETLMINLLQNAMHAMPMGGRVRVSVGADDETARIAVANNGVGIRKEHLGRIFHPFWSWRADGTTGGGLGLAICKATVAKWGGAIGVDSEWGEGATFTVTLPHASKSVASA